MKHRKQNRVGRWGEFSVVPVKGVQEAVMEILRDYGDVVYEATEEGLTAASYVLVDKLREATPKIKKPPKGYQKKNFGKRWKVEGIGKYRLRRYVGNTTTVSSKEGDPISLANIFEYSTTRGYPFVKETYENSIGDMAAAAVAEIKKEV